MQEKFFVLEAGKGYDLRWYTEHNPCGRALNHTHNILCADRYATEEEALQHAPDKTWKPKYVDWFEICNRPDLEEDFF